MVDHRVGIPSLAYPPACEGSTSPLLLPQYGCTADHDSPPISAIGFGLLYTCDFTTSNAKLIGFQILAGFGIGLSFQMPLMAIQGELQALETVALLVFTPRV